MFGNLELFIDQLEYDKAKDQTKISGWGFNKKTKNRLEVSSDFEMLYNPASRPDLVQITGVNRGTPYGFFIQFPGDYRKSKGTLTFDSDDVHRSFKLKDLDLLRNRLRVERLLYNLDEPRLKLNKLLRKSNIKKSSAVPDDEYASWIKEVEESLFEEEIPEQVPISYVIRNGDGLKETVKSLKLKEGDEYIVTDNTSGSVSDAVRRAKNDYVTLVDSGDILSDHFKNEISVKVKESLPDFIYSDSDSIADGVRYDLNFKPDYNETLLEHTNYIMHPIVFRKKLFEKIGGIRDEFDGLKDYDLILRLTKNAEKVAHIPKILYHWNKKENIRKDKTYIEDIERGIKILNDYIPENLAAETSEIDYVYDLCTKTKDEPSVTVIMVFDNEVNPENLEYLREFTDYRNWILDVVNDNIQAPIPGVNYLEFKDKSRVEIYNEIGLKSSSDYLCFVREGFLPVERHWLRDLVTYATLEKVGIVGPKIFNGNYQFEEIGLFIDRNRRHSFGSGGYVRNNGYFNAYRLPREIFAVNLDCLLIKTELFKELGGFDLTLDRAEVDIDLSIRARKQNFKTVVSANTPVTFDSFEEHEGKSLEQLLEKYGSEALKDRFVTEHLKPSGSAYDFYVER